MSEEEKKRKPRFSKRLIIFSSLLILVCLIIALITFLGSASLRRLSYWIFDGVRGDGTEETISFNENPANLFAFTDGKLSVISPDLLSVYELAGSSSLSAPAILRQPALSASSTAFLAYDLGGLNYYIADDDEVLLSGTADSKILNANLNESGAFTITTDTPDFKALVTAYDSDFKTIYKFHSSEKYVFDAALSPDCEIIAVANYGTSNGSFETSLSLCRTNEKSFFATVSLGSSMPLNISFISDDKISVVCDDRLLLFDDVGKQIAEIKYENATLEAFSSAYDNHISVLLSNNLSTGNKKLIVLQTDGSSKAFDTNDTTFSLSASGEYTALLYAEKCVVYKNDLSVHCEVKTSSKISRCLANDDGSLLLLSDTSAVFFVK